MELNEALHRIFGQHWRLILVSVVLCAGAALATHRNDVDTYRATTRFVIDAEDPTSQTESSAVADTAKAIATSPAQVREALRSLRISGRDPVEIGRERIELRALGTSGVLQISVSDRNPTVAARLADEIARGVIAKRLDIKRGHLREVEADLEARIERLTDKIEELRLDGGPSVPEADMLVQRRSILETQQLNLLATDALAARPSIVSSATVPDEAEPSALVPDLVLATLLGLILGVGLAGLIESLWPTLIGGETVARELDTPLLGTISGGPYRAVDREELRRVATRVRLAAKAAGVRNVGLLAVSENLEVAGFAALIEAAREVTPDDLTARDEQLAPLFSRSSAAVPEAAAPARPACRIRAYDLDRATQDTNGAMSGIVLVSPAHVKKADVGAVTHLLRVSPGPLLGLIAYTASWPLGRAVSTFARTRRFTRMKGHTDGR